MLLEKTLKKMVLSEWSANQTVKGHVLDSIARDALRASIVERRKADYKFTVSLCTITNKLYE